MNKIERVRAVINGQQPDRPPLSFWHHFTNDKASGRAAVDAHIEHLENFDLDFLKVMNDNGYPRAPGFVITSVAQLPRMKELEGDDGSFALQLEVLRRLRQRVGADILMTTTVFSPWSVLRTLTAPEPARHNPPVLTPVEDARDAKLRELLREDQAAVAAGLVTIARSLSNFAACCLAAGADGIFLSVRDDWVAIAGDESTYDAMVLPADRIVCEGMRAGSFNMLHVCGRPLNFARFADYPVQVINWADRAAGPGIAEVKDRIKPAICGGLDNLGTLADGSPEDCIAELQDALRQAGTRPIILSPGCTYDPQRVPVENLKALRKHSYDVRSAGAGL